jgi:hypothetical protein
MPKFTRLMRDSEQTKETAEKWEEKLGSYDFGRRQRAEIISSDFTHFFSAPLLKRITRTMKDQYHDFLAHKERALKEIDAADVPVSSERDIPAPPCLSISKKGLADTTAKYATIRDQEERLDFWLSKQFGNPVQPKRRVLIPLKDPREFDFREATKKKPDKPTGRKAFPDAPHTRDHLTAELRECTWD